MPDPASAPAPAPSAAPTDDLKTIAADALAVIKDVALIAAEVKSLDLISAIANLKDLVGKAQEGLAAIKDLVAQIKALKS